MTEARGQSQGLRPYGATCREKQEERLFAAFSLQTSAPLVSPMRHYSLCLIDDRFYLIASPYANQPGNQRLLCTDTINRSLRSFCQLEDSHASICIEEVDLLTFDIQLHFVANTDARARIKCGNTALTARSEVDL